MLFIVVQKVWLCEYCCQVIGECFVLRIKDHESEFTQKCEEYERQIKHLRQLLREKDDASNLLEMEKKWVNEWFLYAWLSL